VVTQAHRWPRPARRSCGLPPAAVGLASLTPQLLRCDGQLELRAGIDGVVLDTGSRVSAAMLKTPEAATPEGYRVALPGGITFSDTPAQLVERLGQPVAGMAAPADS
jgi:hypothetical protein